MSHARIEEVSDSDPEIEDPSEYLPQSDNAVIRAVAQPSSQQEPEQQAIPTLNPNQLRPGPNSQANYERSREAIKHYCMIYPCYFSSSRTRQQGRRVSKDLAVKDPLAWNILTALRYVIEPDINRIHIAFEPDKTHPKDWSNPGRVRIELFEKETHKPKHPTIRNKEHLYIEVAKYMKQHPTKKTDTLELKIQGLPVPDKYLETKTPKPRGWNTMNDVLPLHSAAVSGGGVRDDFFKEAMAELAQAQGGAGGDAGGMAGLQQMMSSMGGMPGMQGLMGGGGGGGGGESSGSTKKKKDKKKG